MARFKHINRSAIYGHAPYEVRIEINGAFVRWKIRKLGLGRWWIAVSETGQERIASTLEELDAWFGTVDAFSVEVAQ